MSDKELIQSLSNQAAADPVLYDVLLMFSARQRAQRMGSLTLAALCDRMSAEKFRHAYTEYARVLQILAEHKLGTLATTPKGRIRALQGIRVSLPFLGKAVLAGEALKNYRRKATYQRMPVTEQPAPVSKEQRQPRPWQTPSSSVVLTFLLNGKAINLPVPREMTPMEIAELIDKLQGPGRTREAEK